MIENSSEQPEQLVSINTLGIKNDLKFSHELEDILSKTEVFVRNTLRWYPKWQSLCFWEKEILEKSQNEIIQLAEEYWIWEDILKVYLDKKLKNLDFIYN